MSGAAGAQPPGRPRCWWGWGWEDEQLGAEALADLALRARSLLGSAELRLVEPPSLDALELPPPRIAPPAPLAHLCSAEHSDRARHAFGRSFGDVVRALAGQITHPPDLVAHPGSEREVADVLEWASDERVAVVPFGGGSSLTRGVEPDVGDDYAGTLSLDLRRLDAVLEVDHHSLAARIQAGAYGPAIESQLAPHRLSLRHFPQSFEHSTLGGWIATRATGHHATLATHIDERLEAVRALTPNGVLESQRLPRPSAGPSAARLLVGSEGALGVITEAWVRLVGRPRFRAVFSAWFQSFDDGVAAARAMSQADLHPANCRLLDANEVELCGIGSPERPASLLIVGFESADHPVDAWAARATELVQDHGGRVPDGLRATTQAGDAGAWRRELLRLPYLRDACCRLGLVTDSFETICTWDRFADLHEQVTEAVGRATAECGTGTGLVTCRFTHVHPDGPAPCYTFVLAPPPGSQLTSWAHVLQVARQSVLEAGGSETRHALGRDHPDWIDRRKPDLAVAALSGAKRELDPAWVMNPGVLVPLEADAPLPARLRPALSEQTTVRPR